MIRSLRSLGNDWLARVEAYRTAKAKEFFARTRTDADGCLIWHGEYSKDGHPIYIPKSGTADRTILGKIIYIHQFIWYTYVGADELARQRMVLEKFEPNVQSCGKIACIKLEHLVVPQNMALIHANPIDLERESNPFNKAEIAARLDRILSYGC